MSATARAVLERHSKSFALAGKLLPKQSRDDAAVLYAFCRRADDAIDLGDPAGAPDRLRVLHEELASVYAGEAQSDVLLSSFQELVIRRAIPREYPRALLDGFQMDLGRVHFETLSELTLYAYRVAGVVGLMMCHVFGVTDPRALRHAAHLGIAMQLTNVCRDVLEDWERGRLYLPVEIFDPRETSQFSLGLNRPIPESLHSGVLSAVKHLLTLADSYYRSGDLGLALLPGRAAFAVRAARYSYSAIGSELRRRRYSPLGGRVYVPLPMKLLLVARAGFEELLTRLFRRRTQTSRAAELSA